MHTEWEKPFVNRADHPCELCGKTPSSFRGHADPENGPSPEDLDPGLSIEGKPYWWVCDACERIASDEANRASDAWHDLLQRAVTGDPVAVAAVAAEEAHYDLCMRAAAGDLEAIAKLDEGSSVEEATCSTN